KGNNAYGEVIGKGGFDRVEGIVLDQSGEPLIGATVLVPETAIGTITDIDGTFSLNIPTSAKTLKFSYTGFSDTEVPLNSAYLTVRMEEASELMEIVTVSSVSRGLRIRGLSNLKDKHLYIPFNTVVERPLTIEYEIEAPYTILSDGKTHRIDVVQFEVPAVYSYSSIPKKKEAAFLTAQVPDWQELNLPTGEVNLFFENAYIGKSLLNTDFSEDTLEISLGEDKGVFIDRKMVKEFSKKQLIGKNRVVELEFEIFVRNDKRSAIDLTVYDQIPVSFEKSIVVDNVEISDGELDEKTGIITWKVKLNPGESRTFQKKYRVKYPKANGYLKLER
ncbi:MAG: mucoidy inhibitor MuiA family protein, partial [Bacteroidetes bacterium]